MADAEAVIGLAVVLIAFTVGSRAARYGGRSAAGAGRGGRGVA